MSPRASQPRLAEPPVVAELGRPETPEETAARKAESSRLRRQRQTINNLVYSLLATLAVVAIMVLIVPRDDKPIVRHVDYAAAAVAAQPAFEVPLAVPALPEGWQANQAQVRVSDQNVSSWYIGFITPAPETQFAAVSEGIAANEEWLHGQLPKLDPTGAISLGGERWTEYDHRDRPDLAGNAPYALSLAVDGAILVVYGTAAPDQVQLLAESSLASMRSAGPAGGAGSGAS